MVDQIAKALGATSLQLPKCGLVLDAKNFLVIDTDDAGYTGIHFVPYGSVETVWSEGGEAFRLNCESAPQDLRLIECEPAGPSEAVLERINELIIRIEDTRI